METAEAEDLEALFDQVAAQHGAGAEAPAAAAALSAAPAAAPSEPADMFHRVGHLTRTLHDALHELGYDRNIENAVQKLPDACDRLNYIATLTGQAAERVLGAVEKAQAEQDRVESAAAAALKDWDALYAGKLSVEEFKALAGRTRELLATIPAHAAGTRTQLTEIMMAQDFHDLTGQVINRVLKLAQSLEQQLVQLLVEANPARPEGESEWLSGPAMNAGGRSDVVASQAQVDELLGSLGF